MNKISIAIMAAGLVALIGAACGDDSSDGDRTPVIDPGDGGNYAPELDPADFVRRIDNPLPPLHPGLTLGLRVGRRVRADRGRRAR